uniref:Uncharacterized protein n=1 Tax=Anopheles dirus TaxID=7168 RepID=A0A182NNU4_9DIPT
MARQINCLHFATMPTSCMIACQSLSAKMSIIASSASANTQTSASLAQVFSTKSMISLTSGSGSKQPRMPSIRSQFARISASSQPITPFSMSCTSFSVICRNSSGYPLRLQQPPDTAHLEFSLGRKISLTTSLMGLCFCLIVNGHIIGYFQIDAVDFTQLAVAKLQRRTEVVDDLAVLELLVERFVARTLLGSIVAAHLTEQLQLLVGHFDRFLEEDPGDGFRAWGSRQRAQ